MGGMILMRNLVLNLLRDRSGATAIEYGLIAALISVVVIVALTQVGSTLNNVYLAIASALQSAIGAGAATSTG